MAFDKTGFADWLKKTSGRKTTHTAYPASLDALERASGLGIDEYVPVQTQKLLALLEHPAAGKLKNAKAERLRDWRCCVRSYEKYALQRGRTLEPATKKMGIVLGLLQGKLYLASDAFSPEEYPTPHKKVS